MKKENNKNEKENNKNSNTKPIVVSILAVGILLFVTILLVGKPNNIEPENAYANNVTMENGKQIIAINVKGGYSPRVSTAKAGIPTILRFKTNGSFDCSSSLYLPSINYRS